MEQNVNITNSQNITIIQAEEDVKVAPQVASVISPKTVSVETSSAESTKLFDNIHTGKNKWCTYLEQYLNDSWVCQSLLDYVFGTMRRPRLRAAWSLQFFSVELFDKAVKTVSPNILAEDDKRLLSSIRARSVWDFLNTLSKGDDPEMSKIANQIKSEIQSQWEKSKFPIKSESIKRPLSDEEEMERPLPKEPELKQAHVLFMDIVGYSKLKADEQVKTMATLNRIVKDCLPEERRLMLPTGDGMAIAFLTNPESPLLTACKIAPKVKKAGIPLRMGMHTGPVYLVEDIKKQENIIGGGINLAQRVMDCGDAGHILASEEIAKPLSGVKEEYERLFHYLGEFEVKHRLILKIYNVYGEGFGNPEPPQRTPKGVGKIASLSLSLHNQTPPEPNFVGREDMLKTITEWYKDPKVRIGALIGWGGVGKSALVRKWYDSLECLDHVDACSVMNTALHTTLHPDGIFWWGFYRNAYLEAFLNALLKYVSRGEIDPETIKSTWEKVENIKEFIVKVEYLIILDGLEQMQKSGDEFGRMEHRELTELLHYLADAPASGLCLITTRYPLKDLDEWQEQGYNSLSLVDLSLPDALDMLKKRGVKGNDEEMEEVIERYKGHALSLTLLAGFLKKYHGGNIKESPKIEFVLSDEKRFKDVNKLLGRYAEKMSEAELCFLKIFSLFRKEVTEREFSGVFQCKMGFNNALVKMSELDFKDLVNGLVDWRLISFDEAEKTYTTHPLIKGYFESAFDEKEKKLCHKQIYQFFGKLAKDKPQTLEEMQPLFEQVYHGCSAGLYDEVFDNVFREKIDRGEAFIVHKLGAWETALSLARTFFPNNDLSKLPLVRKKHIQSWLLNEAGLALLSTGRPKEAEEVLACLAERDTKGDDWAGASATLQNLAELWFRTGRLKEAKEGAQKAIELEEKAWHKQYIMISKTYLGWILHLLGEDKEAEKEFQQADEIEVKISSHRLYSLPGVFYADFLISTNRIDEALGLTQANLKICQKNNWLNIISRCHRCLGAIERLKGDHKEAKAHLQTSLKIARNVGMPSLEIEALLESGRLWLDMKRYEDAIQEANHVLKLCERTGFKLYEPEAELILARAYPGQKNRDKAKESANSAYEKAAKMGYHWPKTEAAKLLEEIG